MQNDGQQAETLFHRALEFPSAERAAFLTGACGNDPALHQRVEALLAAHDLAIGFLPAESRPESIATVIGEPPLSEEAGLLIGRYKLLEKLGEGGFGAVWLAEQKEPVRRKVALKIIKLGMDTRQVVARFEAERQALALMDHPNIAKVLDAGATESGRPYFVMELVRGIPMTKFCDENGMPTKDRLDLFIKVCHAIQHAHQKGIIHRDIKPSNVLVTLHDGVPVPKVIDFGIAKATQGELTDKTIHTQFQQFIGTPAYMSPEQAEMSGLDIDTRSDIYSLGVLLYELLTGKTPFDGKELLASGLDAMRRTIREKEPLRPSTKLSQELAAVAATRKIAADSGGKDGSALTNQRYIPVKETIALLRGDLDWIVMKCLEKDRTRRYETTNGLVADLKRHLSNEPVVARPPSAAYRFQKAFRRNKLAFAATAAVAVALVIGLVAATWQFLRERQTRKRAETAERAQNRLRETAQEAQARETSLRHQADAQKLAARRRAYASDMIVAQQALAVNNLGRAQELLDRNRAQPGEKDLRGWEWRYLWQQCRSDALYTLCQRSNEIFSVAVSQDGKWVAVGERASGQLSLWDLRTRQEVDRLPAGEGSVRVAFSSRESLLAFSWVSGPTPNGRRHGVRVWDGATRRIVSELSLGANCYGLQFSGDGRTLVTSTGEPENQIAIWRVPEGKKLESYPAPQIDYGIGTSLAVARDLSVAAHSLPRNGFRVIDLSNGKELWKSQIDTERVYTLALSPDGKILASYAGLLASPIRLWDVASERQIGHLEGHRAYVGELVFWPDGKTLASASADQSIRLWDLNNLTNAPSSHTLLGHHLEVPRLALLPDNTTLVSGCKDGSIYVWDRTTPRREHTRVTLPATMSAWRFSLDSRSVLTVDRRGQVAQWLGKEFREVELLLDIGTNQLRPCISDDGRWLAVGSTNGMVRVWDLLERTSNELALHPAPVLPWSFLSQGKKLAVIHPGEGSVQQWDLTTRQEIQTRRSTVEAVEDDSFVTYRSPGAFSPDERWRLALGYQRSSVLSDTTTGQETSLRLERRGAVDAAFSSDGSLFAVASDYGFARLWETATLREVVTLRGFLLGVHSVTFSPDGRRIATGSSGNETIKLWDVEGGQEVLTLEGQGGVFNSSAFSPDGNVLGSMSNGGVLHLWRAPSWEEIATAEAKQKMESTGQ